MNLKEGYRLIPRLVVLVGILGALGFLPDIIVSTAIKWLLALFIGGVTSWISGEFVEQITGNLLKKINFKVYILGKKFSVTLFAVVTLAVKFWFF